MLDCHGAHMCLPDVKGLGYLATLLANPGVPIAAVQLADHDGGAHPDPGADLRALRERARDLEEELAEARAFNDPERIARLVRELEKVAGRMAIADEHKTAAAERARVNVTRAIKAAIRRVDGNDPRLGRMLRSTVRTGTTCAYEPDPGAPVVWDVQR